MRCNENGGAILLNIGLRLARNAIKTNSWNALKVICDMYGIEMYVLQYLKQEAPPH